VQLECFYAAQVARRMEKTTVTGTLWRIGGYPGGGLSSAKCSILEKLTTLSRRPGVRPSTCSKIEEQQRRWRCFPRIALLRSVMNMLSRFVSRMWSYADPGNGVHVGWRVNCTKSWVWISFLGGGRCFKCNFS